MSHVMELVKPLTDDDYNPATPLYFIGIGGAGMSVIALMLTDEGYNVSGSDRHDGPNLKRLRDAGITCHVGHDPHHVPPQATVVVSSAIALTNPELAVAIDRGQRIIHRSQALMIASRGQRFIAVAGAHGKTTTSAWIAQALACLGKDPSFAVGGVVKGYGSGAHVGTDKLCIAEADESDKSFLHYRPSIGLITNIEPDHLDFYGSRDAFEAAFATFASNVSGSVVICRDDEGARRLATRLVGQVPHLVTYGTGEGCAPDDGDTYRHYQITDINPGHNGCSLIINGEGGQWPATIPAPGVHNALNATGAWCVGVELGEDPAAMAKALSCFQGTGRRFDMKATVNNIRIVDDYAHHPTEVEALMAQAHQANPDGRILVIFQPHLYSRTRNFADRFARALDRADIAVVCDIFAAREDPIDGVTSQLITSRMNNGTYIGDMHHAARWLADQARPGDMILSVGAGDITTVTGTIIDTIKGR